jgi:hypothetical protein
MSNMSGVNDVKSTEVDVSGPGVSEKDGEDKHLSDSETSDVLVGPNGEHYPSTEDLKTLRRTHGHVPILLYTIAFVELCERFAYYGTIIVCGYNLRRRDDTLIMQSTTISIGHCQKARELVLAAEMDRLVRWAMELRLPLA